MSTLHLNDPSEYSLLDDHVLNAPIRSARSPASHEGRTHLGSLVTALLKLLKGVAPILVHREAEDVSLKLGRVVVEHGPATVLEAARDEEVA